MASSNSISNSTIMNSQIGNEGTVIINCGSDDASRLAMEIERWLDASNGDEKGYAEIASLRCVLETKGIEAAKGFFRRNREAIAANLASTAIWGTLIKVLGAD